MSVTTENRRSEVTAVMAGIGGCLPDHAVKNDEIAERIGETTDWIRDRTGIEQRFVLPPHQAMSDLAVEAGLRALDSCGNPEVDFLILATCTPDHLFPATAPNVAARLGLPGIAAFDLNAACSGFIYSLSVAEGLLVATGALRHRAGHRGRGGLDDRQPGRQDHRPAVRRRRGGGACCGPGAPVSPAPSRRPAAGQRRQPAGHHENPRRGLPPARVRGRPGRRSRATSAWPGGRSTSTPSTG